MHTDRTSHYRTSAEDDKQMQRSASSSKRAKIAQQRAGSGSDYNSTSTTESYLVALSQNFLCGVDGSRDFDWKATMRRHCTPNFTPFTQYMNDACFPSTKTLEDHIAAYEVLSQNNSDWRVRAYNFSADVNEKHGFAVVWFTSGGSGAPGEGLYNWSTCRESVSKLFWRTRADGEWECHSHWVMRGGGSFVDVPAELIDIPQLD